MMFPNPVIASAAKQSSSLFWLDCRVATLLAMTVGGNAR